MTITGMPASIALAMPRARIPQRETSTPPEILFAKPRAKCIIASVAVNGWMPNHVDRPPETLPQQARVSACCRPTSTGVANPQ
jgi:hypothetical protein